MFIYNHGVKHILEHIITLM